MFLAPAAIGADGNGLWLIAQRYIGDVEPSVAWLPSLRLAHCGYVRDQPEDHAAACVSARQA